MKIAVIGANGMIGSQIVSEALSRKHQVTAYTRSGTQIEGTTSVALELTNTSTVAKAINSHDFTVITVASRDNYQAAIDAHTALIHAAPTGRFLIVGGAGSLEINGTRLYETPDFPSDYSVEARTFGQILDLYRSAPTDVQWTIAAPSPEIAPATRTGRYILGSDSPVGDFVSTQDFAIAIIDEAEKKQNLRRRFTVATEQA
ncbi:NAD(P)-dependent oxidoreductase [Schaalia sp. lx-260]|uniref:NAD(P)-dependent oxidoreductase n=1 Tax=Schaalia sp. lx-260 TaxID=2899082 RepID=UPI001E4F5B37|nr:NAD(P)H-binding protein [Schaalia sp. lx-260]MCD4549131.1 NAD(P)H-binding protein [Schaalia sp. lx-260]